MAEMPAARPKHDSNIEIVNDEVAFILAPPPGLTKAEIQEFEALYREICADVKPRRFIEQNWCRTIASAIWRLRKFEEAREEFTLGRLDLALSACLLERTSEDIFDLMARIRDGDVEAIQRLADLKAKFEITDAQLRACVEIRNRTELSRIDQEMRAVELTRDRIIELIEKRRFMSMANLRLAGELPKTI